MLPEIVVSHVTRRFRSQESRRGLSGALRDLLLPREAERVAVGDLSFEIAAGEAVALIGPNGAGKSTTVKLLTGILKPSDGTVRVGGLDPWADRAAHVKRLGAVFGQRTGLWWDLAVIEAMDMIAAMYAVPDAIAAARLKRFEEVLGIGPLLKRPVRELSLGERVRCELAGALLHEPPLLFLDEPTVGLDVGVKLRLQQFLAELRIQGRTTLVLTTHDLADVRAICPRVLLLSAGKLLHDGPLDALAHRLGSRRLLTVLLRTPISDAALAALPPSERIGPLELRFALEDATGTAELVRAVLASADVADLRIDEPPIEALIARFYGEGA